MGLAVALLVYLGQGTHSEPGSLRKMVPGYGEAGDNLTDMGLRYPQVNLTRAAWGLSIPNLAALPRHGDAG
jgi:hypothetical protein